MDRTADVEHREHEPATVVIVAGVSGSGKSTVGQALADALGVPFVDGDDLHSAANVAKMHSGRPLTEQDRLPWLAALASRIGALSAATGGVIACSALKRRYRDALTAAAPDVLFFQLALRPETARARMAARKGHFMPASLVKSQFDEFEPLEPAEVGIALDATGALEENVDTFREYLRRQPAVREKVRGTIRLREGLGAKADADESRSGRRREGRKGAAHDAQPGEGADDD